MKPTIELLKPILENHKPMIVVFKHRLEVQTRVCNLETYVSRLIVHLACDTGNISVQELLAFYTYNNFQTGNVL